jgi:hypothetical protein
MLNNESSNSYTHRVYTNPDKTRNNQRKALGCYKSSSTNINEIGTFKELQNIFKFLFKLFEVSVFCPKTGRTLHRGNTFASAAILVASAFYGRQCRSAGLARTDNAPNCFVKAEGEPICAMVFHGEHGGLNRIVELPGIVALTSSRASATAEGGSTEISVLTTPQARHRQSLQVLPAAAQQPGLSRRSHSCQCRPQNHY